MASVFQTNQDRSGSPPQEITPVSEFDVETPEGTQNILDADTEAVAMGENAEDEALREYIIGVDWADTRPQNKAHWETGMYANQNTVTKLRNQYTLERLYDHFEIDE